MAPKRRTAASEADKPETKKPRTTKKAAEAAALAEQPAAKPAEKPAVKAPAADKKAAKPKAAAKPAAKAAAKPASKAEAAAKPAAKAKAAAKPAAKAKAAAKPAAKAKEPKAKAAKPSADKKAAAAPKKAAKAEAKPAEPDEEEPAAAEETAAAAEAKPAASAKSTAKPKATRKGALSVGDQLPEFEVEVDTSTADKQALVSSKDITKDNGAVIFFYPKANTGGCTKQALGFNENASKLEAAGYKVFGMSADKPKSQSNWKTKYSLTYSLLSDPSWQVLKMLGVTKGEKQIARSHIIVGKGGSVEDVQIGISPGDSVAKAVKKILGDDA